MKPLEIKGARTRLGFSQQLMADKLEMSLSSYQKKESGSVEFTFEQKIKTAKILGLSFEEMDDFLFDGELNHFIAETNQESYVKNFFDKKLPIGIA